QRQTTEDVPIVRDHPRMGACHARMGGCLADCSASRQALRYSGLRYRFFGLICVVSVSGDQRDLRPLMRPMMTPAPNVAAPSTRLRRTKRSGGSPVSHEVNQPVSASARRTATKVNSTRRVRGDAMTTTRGTTEPRA